MDGLTPGNARDPDGSQVAAPLWALLSLGSDGREHADLAPGGSTGLENSDE